MKLQRFPKKTLNLGNFHMYDNDTIIVDYVEMLRTNGNYERRIEELNEAIRRLNEELHRVTYINIDYTIQPNGSR